MKVYNYLIAALLLLVFSNPLMANFRADYDKAYKAFQNAKTTKQKTAVAKTFETLSLRKDAGTLKANSVYWEAECWFQLKDYQHALNKFERVLLHPQSNKEEAARFKVAVRYVKLGLIETAKWELSRFLRDYPASKLTTLVRKELNAL